MKMATPPIDTIKGMAGKDISVFRADFDNSQIDQEGFLKILLTSFKYQDPFEAQDISKFIENTVKLRELEVMKRFEDSVKALNDNNTLFLNTTNLIDKKVVYKGNETYIEAGKGRVEFIVKKDVSHANIYIYDDNDNVVAQKEFSDLKAGQKYSFDIDDEGIADGYYKVSVVAKDGDEPIKSEIFSTALVKGIQKDGSSILALFDKGNIKISDIIKIGG